MEIHVRIMKIIKIWGNSYENNENQENDINAIENHEKP